MRYSIRRILAHLFGLLLQAERWQAEGVQAKECGREPVGKLRLRGFHLHDG
jgi:hypothetical protein